MSRIFRSTTALAASLSLIAPSFAMAETPLTQAEFEQLQAQTSQGQPHLAAALVREIADGLTSDQLTCMDDSARPCADDVALKTPSGMAVRISESGEIALAPRSEQDEQVANAIAGAAMAVVAPGAAPAADAAAAALGPSEGELAAALAAEAPEVTNEPAPEAQVIAQADAPVILPETSPEITAEPGPEPTPEVAAEAPAPVAAPEATAEPVVPETAAAPEPQPEAPAETPEPPAQAADSPAPEPVPPAPEVAASPDTPAQPAAPEAGPSEDDVAAALAAESEPEAPAAEPVPVAPAEQQSDAAPASNPETQTTDDGLAAALAAAQGEEQPADSQVAAPTPITPESAAQALAASTGQQAAPQPVEVTAEQQSALTDALASVAAATTPATAPQPPEQATEQPAAVVPAPEATATAGIETPADDDDRDAAALAAAAALAPVAAALLAPAQLSDSATSVVVTPESARSSAEDFGTSIAQAVAAAQNAPVVTAGQAAPTPVGPSGETVPSDPVVVTPATPPGATPTTVAEDDDDDNTLRNLLIAGLGAYAVGTILQNQNRVALNTGDRVVTVARDGSQQVYRNDDALLLTPGAQVTTENFSDGSSRTIVSREDGSRVVTIRDAQLRVLRRTLIQPNGSVVDLINEATPVAPVEVAALPPAARPVVVSPSATTEELREALRQEAAINRSFSLSQIRNIAQVRNLVAPISIDSITFDTASAAIRPDQARQLATLGNTISGMIAQNPGEVFLIEGYTDTVGGEAMNLALSDRRAESLALALTEYFEVPPENLIVQGYGERFLAVPQEGDIRENRRVAVRRITDLLNN